MRCTLKLSTACDSSHVDPWSVCKGKLYLWAAAEGLLYAAWCKSQTREVGCHHVAERCLWACVEGLP